MNNEIKGTSYFENDSLILENNKLITKNEKIEAVLGKNQKYLLLCLMKKINEKNEIISCIWDKGNCNKNSYNQLIYQTRELLARSGFPPNMIVTIPRYGVYLNQEPLTTQPKIDEGLLNVSNLHTIF
ncbi:winged helix-turn-helix domain-containing protein [Serratia fonticola]|uniref:winged helix-turn-helix domain-containing protein n=1 Tax=Serratia fonticola TaxID=47917 RepID=UPI00217738F7|nr:hypothetical protein [Serratia fonticola]CAI1000658.1 Uncharacterised protein [Serratia fonticola]CAI1194580.1 Uncharacterised protein [Serratia fonticola]CAI1966624.1 Uncharacterised protein [Serratia fonticola]CAI2001635.1 Uncharacterised protein [Serratia fonticola]